MQFLRRLVCFLRGHWWVNWWSRYGTDERFGPTHGRTCTRCQAEQVSIFGEWVPVKHNGARKGVRVY